MLDKFESLIANTTRYLRLLRNSTQSLEKQDSPTDQINRINDPALGLELFRTYRSMIEHETTLLNQRVNWFLVTQGFLFAAFATVLSVEISCFTLFFLLIISGTGVIYSYLALNPISLSLLAVHTLKEEWKKRAQIQVSDPLNPGQQIDNPDGLITNQVKRLLPKQVCFDAEEGITIDKSGAITSDSILKNYFPRYYTYFLKSNQRKSLQERTPKSRDYRRRINSIPIGTMIIWFVILIYFVMYTVISTVNQGYNKFFKQSFFVIIDLIYLENTTEEATLKLNELKEILNNQSLKEVKLRSDELKEILDNQSLPLKTAICLKPTSKKEEDTQKKIDTYDYEEVLLVTQNKDNIPFALSKRLFEYSYNYANNLVNNEKLDKEIQTKIAQKIKSILPQPEITEDEKPEAIEEQPETIIDAKLEVKELKIRENKLKFCQE